MAAKDKLNDRQRTFIVQALACYDPPSKVVELVKEEFDLKLSRQLVAYYDPSHSVDLAKKWREIFEATRKRFLEDVALTGIAHKAVRLRVADRQMRRAEAKGNGPMVKEFLEYAAKDVGEAFTNRREVTGKDGTPLAGGVLVLPQGVSADEWASAAAASQAKLPGSGGAGDAPPK